MNELERRGVELEVKLRSEDGEGIWLRYTQSSFVVKRKACGKTECVVCVTEGADDSVTDELMVEWFSLIRNKQVAMRRESELVYM